MVKVNADLGQMCKLGNYMITKSEEFNTITTKMNEIVSMLQESWVGADANVFIANAQAYIANLKAVELSMAQLGGYVNKKAVGYNNRIATYFQNMRG